MPGPWSTTSSAIRWNLLPLGQILWLKERESSKALPPLQAPEAYNLDGIMAEMQVSRTSSHAGE
jgi:hypothetical protein